MQFPSEQDYQDFLTSFSQMIAYMGECCFFTYGSINNGHDIGRSDIDGGIIIGSEIVTPKEKVLKIAQGLANALEDKPLKVHLNLLDLETCKDGRFLSFTSDYTDWFKGNVTIHAGPDYISSMSGKDYKAAVLSSAAFNFTGPSGIRNAVLFSSVYEHKGTWEEKAIHSLEKVAKFPKKLLWLQDQGIVNNRFEANTKLQEMFPEQNIEHFHYLDRLLSDPHELSSKVQDFQRGRDLVIQSLTSMEELIQSYCQKYEIGSGKEFGGDTGIK